MAVLIESYRSSLWSGIGLAWCYLPQCGQQTRSYRVHPRVKQGTYSVLFYNDKKEFPLIFQNLGSASVLHPTAR